MNRFRLAPILLAPLGAALLLAGCNRSAEDDLSEEALTLDDLAGLDVPMALVPGQYRSTTELLEFALPDLPDQALRLAEAAFAEGAASGHSYCLTEEMGAEDWLSQMNESQCTVSRFTEAGGQWDAVLQCSDPEGMNGRVEMSGTAAGENADMELRFTQPIPGMGEGTIRMRVLSERLGDCT